MQQTAITDKNTYVLINTKGNIYSVESKFTNHYNQTNGAEAKIDTGAEHTIISANLVFTNPYYCSKALQEIKDKSQQDPSLRRYITGVFSKGIAYYFELKDIYLGSLFIGTKNILITFDNKDKFLIGNDLLKSLIIFSYPKYDTTNMYLYKLNKENLEFQQCLVEEILCDYFIGKYGRALNKGKEVIEVNSSSEVNSF